ncbi:DUF6630 family protein [Amycolatopsis rhabdoformis]|uniref:DUF6630 family protein n=1 Tax=Amycolatopsis rhabdoformis TaxID=1448059 RepID=A0ABZ1IC67_9PSEU|nr:DUF6630 family protein [Amycolatopsis rhabdoformis]WSE32069.1 DUF6630 family protein [Amycolatopsis rhabdoformis]
MTTPPRDALAAVAALLAPNSAAVSARALAARDDPDAYLRDHADRLDDRGIDEPFEGLPWIALVDALDDHGLLAEVDWKEAADEIVGRLRKLSSAPRADELWDELAASDLPTFEFLEAAGERLLTLGTALGVLDIESDCYPLVLLPADRADDLMERATEAGFAAGVYGSQAG